MNLNSFDANTLNRLLEILQSLNKLEFDLMNHQISPIFYYWLLK